MNSCAPASCAAAMPRSMGIAGSVSAMLSRTDRLNRTLSCSTTPTWRRSQAVSDHREVDAVDKNAARFRDVKALDQLCERALAGAGGADHADNLPRRHLERH